MIAQAWQSSAQLGEWFVVWLATSGLRIFVVVLLAAIAVKVLQVLTARLRKVVIGDDDCTERRQRAETLTAVAQTVGGIVIFIGASPSRPSKRSAKEITEDPRLKSDVLGPLEILGLDTPTKAPIVKARITTRPRRQWDVGRELNLRIRQRFTDRGIELR